jgi:putative ABC transport system permease protein
MAFFSVFWMVLKRVWNNRRLEANLLAALIVALAVIASVPIYTDGGLQYVLTKQWFEASSGQSNWAPGSMMMWHTSQTKLSVDTYAKVTAFLEEEAPERIAMPLIRQQHYATIDNPFPKGTADGTKYARFTTYTNFLDMVDLIGGRFPEDSDPAAGEPIEALISIECLEVLEFVLGQSYEFSYTLDPNPDVGRYTRTQRKLPFQIVGVFRVKDEYVNSAEFYQRPSFRENLFITEETFKSIAGMEGIKIGWVTWYWLFDHTGVRVHDLPGLVAGMVTLESEAAQISPAVRWSRGPLTVWQRFVGQSRVLRTLMFALSIPILGIVFYYIILAAQLMVNSRRTEIAMLQSRGAGKAQICASYVIEWCILGAIAMAVSPYLGLLIAQVMGASRGFLSFVDRQPLPAQLFSDPYVVASIALAATVAMIIVPVLSAARQSIVNYKQEVSRKHRMPIWQRIPMDLILLVFSGWGYYTLRQQAEAGIADQSVILNPSLFLIPAVLMLGVGLLTLRVFPWLIRLLDSLTSSWSGVAWNMTLKQLYRSPEQYNPLILLIILTLALGIYSSSTARTMDRNFTDRVSYQMGAEVILNETWVQPSPPEIMGPEGEPTGEVAAAEAYEPPFYVHENLDGVEAAARVMRINATVTSPSRLGGVTILAISPHEFAKVVWYRDGLLDYHVNSYLNLLIARPGGVLISESALQRAQLEPGDMISVQLRGVTDPLQLQILAPVKYWPTLYPDDGIFAIADIDYVRSVLPIEPYAVWLKMAPDASLSEIVQKLSEEGVYVASTKDLRNVLIEGIRDPQRMGLYGMLSTGFLVAALITVMGFLLYTFLSLRSRMLQFGVLRAIGLKVRQLMLMLVYEQVFTVGLGVAVGTILGEQVSRLFLPMLKLSVDSQRDVPPFMVVVEWGDKAKIYLVLGVALLIGMIGVGVLISTLKIHQAVKLGEDQ